MPLSSLFCDGVQAHLQGTDAGMACEEERSTQGENKKRKKRRESSMLFLLQRLSFLSRGAPLIALSPCAEPLSIAAATSRRRLIKCSTPVTRRLSLEERVCDSRGGQNGETEFKRGRRKNHRESPRRIAVESIKKKSLSQRLLPPPLSLSPLTTKPHNRSCKTSRRTRRRRALQGLREMTSSTGRCVLLTTRERGEEPSSSPSSSTTGGKKNRCPSRPTLIFFARDHARFLRPDRLFAAASAEPT